MILSRRHWTRLVALLALVASVSCGDDGDGHRADDSESVAEVGGPDSDSLDSDSDAGAPDVDSGADVAIDLPGAVDASTGEDATVDDAAARELGDVFFDPDTATSGGDATIPSGPLSVSAVDPSEGPAEGRIFIMVVGSGFTVDTVVAINGRLCEDIDVVDDQTLLARTPANPAGIYDLKVANRSGDAVLTGAFTYFDRIAGHRIEPATGPSRGGFPVVVHGSGFTEGTRLSIGGRMAIAQVVASPSRIEAIAPQGTAGPAEARLTGERGTTLVSEGFSYFDEPSIVAIQPAAGDARGGTTVAIVGDGLASTTRVDVGMSSATIESAASSAVEVTTPPGAPGAVDVTASGPFGADVALDGFYYVDLDAEQPRIDAVVPSSGDVIGGALVTIAGVGVDEATEVRFGGAVARIERVSPGAVVVEVPAGTVGSVTVEVDRVDETLSLAAGFTYVATLSVADVTPARGDATGGDRVTVRGAGFNADTRVYFGPIAAAIHTWSSDAIEVTTPPGSVGATDVRVVATRAEAVARDAFTYTEPAEVSSIAPTRAAIAGDTLVIVRGRGFDGHVRVQFGDHEAASVEVVDASTLFVRTPRVDAATRVDVRVFVDDVEVGSPSSFMFYDPYSPVGGWWGAEVDGAVNVTVIDTMTGVRIEDAFVTLHLRASDSNWTCRTNAVGQCTISESELSGRQTVTAAAEGYSAATITDVNAENVIVFLSPIVPPSSGEPPEVVPPLIRGGLTGLDKIAAPGDGERIIGIVRTTTPGVGAQNPPGTGFAQVEWVGGSAPRPYQMYSREGELAVVAHCGLYNERTGIFRPLYMGVQRGLAIRGEGTVYDVDIACDIHLGQTLTFKLTNPPLFRGGPDINEVFAYLNFGAEGAADFLQVARGRDEVLTQGNYAALSAPGLDGVQYDFTGQSVVEAGGLPYAVAFARDVRNIDDRITFPEMVPPADLLHPAPGATLVERRFEWRLSTLGRPDFYYAYITDSLELFRYWEVWLPGDQSGFNLPFFPPGSESGDLPPGPLLLIVLSVNAVTFDYDAFTFNDFRASNWRSYSAAGWYFFNP